MNIKQIADTVIRVSTYTQIIYHIVFSTKNREPVLDAAHCDALFKYIHGIIKNKSSHLHQIGGARDHIHILTSLHPTVSLADLVKEIKTSSTNWIKQERLFPRFSNWQEGYGAFTCSITEKDALIKYIQGQQEHHRRMTFLEEYRKFLVDAGIKFDERYLV